jgi:glutamate N-acetyltransferase/amino-acid N-acetyltransferase
MIAGFSASGVAAGIKPRGLDLGLIACDAPAVAAGVFTVSQAPGAPVLWSRARIAAGRARAVVVNAGNANVSTGARGARDVEAMARSVAAQLGCPVSQVLVASTGVIGVPLPMSKVRAGIPRAVAGLRASGLPRFARAILTTDTGPKESASRARVGGCDVGVAGVAKGSGMIEPDMATMLSFVLSDVAASPAFLRASLKRAVHTTFNRLSVDAEMSTSDMVLLLASGRAQNPTLRSARSPGAEAFEAALHAVCDELARAVARDGEGATKLLTVRISGARTEAEAVRAARRIANSMLVKTAVYGADPNWGRILQTLGAADVPIDPGKLRIEVGGAVVFRRGAPAGKAAAARAQRAMREDEVVITADLGRGTARGHIYSCDLTHGYISINAEYTT